VYQTGSPHLTHCPEISILQNCFTLLVFLSLFSLGLWSTLCYFLQISSQKFLFYPLNIHLNHHQSWFLWCILCFFLPSLAIQVSSWTCLYFFLKLNGGLFIRIYKISDLCLWLLSVAVFLFWFCDKAWILRWVLFRNFSSAGAFKERWDF